MRSRLERDVARDIGVWMALHGYRAVRCVAGPTRARAGQKTPETSNPAGFPDWVFILPAGQRAAGRGGAVVRDAPPAIFVEMKRPGQRPTKLQQAWLDMLRLDGHAAEWFDGFQFGEGNRPFMPWWKREIEGKISK
mgnify:FL=1